MKKAVLIAICLGVSVVGTAFGFTLEGTFTGTMRYVSKSGSDSNGGTGWNDAKLTIQAAVDLCSDGDTVIVDDGEYSDTTAWTVTSGGTTYTNPAVVQITKRIHLVSRNGKDKTHIVGQWASTSTGVANDGTAHRCIYVNNIANVLIEGFTIRDGATAGAAAGNNNFDSAGGVCGGTGSSGYLVDCDVVNCRAGLGAALSRSIVPIRCSFRGNLGVCSDYTQHVFYRTTAAYNCIFVGNGPVGQRTGSCFSVVQGAKLANCTFINNNCYAFRPNNGAGCSIAAYNCAFLGDGESAAETSSANAGCKYVYLTNCVQTATTGRMAEEDAYACMTNASAQQFYYSMESGDWHYVDGCNLLDAGTDGARAVMYSLVPEEYLDVDYVGNARTAGACVDIGAFEIATASGEHGTGIMVIDENITMMTNDVACAVPVGLPLAFDAFPGQVRLVPAFPDGDPFFGFAVTGDWTLYRFPDLGTDGGAWLTPPPFGQMIVISAKAAAEEMWVQADYAGGDSDGTEEKPYTTITEAADAIATYGLIHVRKGVYDTGSSCLSGHTLPARVAIDKSVAVRSVDGADDTFIVGDASTRCVAVRSWGYDVHLQGFTITGGTADTDAANGSSGAGFWVTPHTWSFSTGLSLNDHCSHVTDCVFSNNVARQGAAMCGGWAQRCVFTGNRVGDTCKDRGAVIVGAAVSACLVTNNLQSNASTITSLYACAPYNVTFAETNKCTDGTVYRPVDKHTSAFNCAFLGGYLDDASTTMVPPAGNVGDTSLDDKDWITLYDRDELFVDPGAGDLHLRPGSGSAYDGDGTADRAAMFAVGDFEGNALVYVNGNPIPGAYSDVDITAHDWYVDAVNGNDAADGTTPATARKTLAAVLPLAGYGDTVHAAAGDYNDGTNTYSGKLIIAAQNGAYSPARGVVPKGVTLVSDEGPDVTFITGQRGEASNGLGETAVRCLTMLRASTVSGFTLRTGATFNTTGSQRDENMGGCVLAPSCADGVSATALIENCIVTNGKARTAGCVAGGILRRCTVVGGACTSGAALSMYSRFEHCLVVNTIGNTAVRYCGGMSSTTFINTAGGASHSSNGELLNTLSGACFENSILITQNQSAPDDSHVALPNVLNCVWCVGGDRLQIDAATSASVITNTIDEALLDAANGYRPLVGSPAINAGDQTLLANLTDGGQTDFVGIQRVYDGEVDIGAYEYDIRPAMAAALNPHATVSAADPVARLADGKITLSDGEVTAALGLNRDAHISMPVEVTGTGTLSVYLGDATDPAATVTAGSSLLALNIPSGAAMRFVYEPGADDTGAALFSGLTYSDGTLLIIR